jgi:hypothetical protein
VKQQADHVRAMKNKQVVKPVCASLSTHRAAGCGLTHARTLVLTSLLARLPIADVLMLTLAMQASTSRAA